MTWELEFTAAAKKDLASIARVQAKRVLDGLRRLASEMTTHGRPVNSDVKKLVNRQGEFRLRVGDYRSILVFQVENDLASGKRKISVIRVIHRGSAYRD